MKHVDRMAHRLMVLIVSAGIAAPAYSGVTFTGEYISVMGELDEGDEGSDSRGSFDFSSFSETALATAAGQSAGGSVTCTDLSVGGQLAYIGSGQITSSAVDTGPQIDAISGIGFRVSFEVSGEAVPFQLIANAQPGYEGDVARSEVRIELTGVIEEYFFAYRSCSSFDGCSGLSVDESRMLPPGFYSLTIGFRADAGQGGNQASVSGS